MGVVSASQSSRAIEKGRSAYGYVLRALPTSLRLVGLEDRCATEQPTLLEAPIFERMEPWTDERGIQQIVVSGAGSTPVSAPRITGGTRWQYWQRATANRSCVR